MLGVRRRVQDSRRPNAGDLGPAYAALSPTDGATTKGKFYLQDGKLRYRSSRTTGTASLSEDQGKTMLTVMPENSYYKTGKAEYERVKE